MILPKFRFYDPPDIEDTVKLVSRLARKAVIMAGGTDVLVNMKRGIIVPENVISINRINALKSVCYESNVMKIGSCVTASNLAQNTDLRDDFNALVESALSLGSPLIRNLATIGGNIVTARPAGDFLPSLLAYDASLILRNTAGDRTVLAEEFFTGPGESVRKPDELLTCILMKKPAANSGSCYLKLGMRKGPAISIVNVACCLALSEDGDICTARLAIGAVAPTPIRSKKVEERVTGERPNAVLFREAGKLAAKDCRPLDDNRGSAEYRRAVTGVLTERALTTAFNLAKKNKFR